MEGKKKHQMTLVTVDPSLLLHVCLVPICHLEQMNLRNYELFLKSMPGLEACGTQTDPLCSVSDQHMGVVLGDDTNPA